MSTTYVAFDRQSGRILSVHHGANDIAMARRHCAQSHSEYRDEDIEVMAFLPDVVRQEKRYKVDVGSKTLVEAKNNEEGVGFAFGATEGPNPGRHER
jgi:hypothetical protein